MKRLLLSTVFFLSLTGTMVAHAEPQKWLQIVNKKDATIIGLVLSGLDNGEINTYTLQDGREVQPHSGAVYNFTSGNVHGCLYIAVAEFDTKEVVVAPEPVDVCQGTTWTIADTET